MFDRLGRFAARHPWPIIIGWISLTVIILLLAPNLSDVASSDTMDMLPGSAPFNQGYARLGESFPDQVVVSNVVLAIEAPAGTRVQAGAAWELVSDLTAWLTGPDAPEAITSVTSPAAGSPLLSSSLISEDGEMALIMVNLAGGPLEDSTREAIAAIDTFLADHATPGVTAAVTGSGPILGGYSDAALTSVDRTIGVTIILVVLILLLVYRSPVSPLIPLFTVGMSYVITRGIVAWMGQSLMTITSYTDVLLIVVLFGAGTDYCLFLISRFREEMAANGGAAPATERTVHRVGETITSSAGTVIVGFVSMIFAEMGLFNTTGPAMAIGIVVILLSGLTLTPALLTLLGQRAFWPGHASHRDAGRLYERISVQVSQHPAQTILVIALILTPLAVYAGGQKTTYDMLADLPADYPARAGFELLSKHMGGGQTQPINVVLTNLDPDTALAEIDHWTQAILAVDGVGDVRSLSDPLGSSRSTLSGITRVDRQLSLAAEALASFSAGDSTGSAPVLTQETLQIALNALPFVQDYLTTLETRFPQVAGDADLAAIRETLAGLPVAALTGGLDEAMAGLQTHLAGLANTFAAIPDAFYLPDGLPESLVTALNSADSGIEGDPLDLLTSRYVTADRRVARFEVILAGSPYSNEATDVVRTLRGMLPDGAAAVSGYPTVMTDLRDVMDRDTLRSFALVLLGIFIVLLFLLRAVVAPLYLIATILLSYGATMGITRLASDLLFGVDALTWWVPFFMFVMLVALGMDYNIFLMGRVKEEVAQYGTREGVHRAVAATGAIISSAGLIMAGTFGAMTAGVIIGLKQLGFAVAVGVLLDTFVIRTVLVPAIAVLLGRWNWWPGRAPKAPAASKATQESVPVTGDR